MPFIWTHMSETAPKRVNHASAATGDGKIWSFGGYCTGEDYSLSRPIEIHLLDTSLMVWKDVVYDTSDFPQSVPHQRYGHTVLEYDDRIYLWGGRNDEGACNRLFIFDPQTLCWTSPKVSGCVPRSRDGHSAALVSGQMYIFGGFEDETERFSQDLYGLDLKSNKWTYIVTQGVPPKWRDFHTSTSIGHIIYVFGGRADVEGQYHTRREVYDDKLYSLDLRNNRWSQLDSSNSPRGRRSHSAFVYNNRLFIWGGFNGILNEHFNDLHSYDPESNSWTEVRTIGCKPCPRRRQSCCLIKSRLYLFGGTSPTKDAILLEEFHNPELRLVDQNDLHVLDLNPSLETLAKLAVLKYNLDINALPKFLQDIMGDGCISSFQFRRDPPTNG